MTAESSETHSAPPQATAATARRGAPAQTGLIRQAYDRRMELLFRFAEALLSGLRAEVVRLESTA